MISKQKQIVCIIGLTLTLLVGVCVYLIYNSKKDSFYNIPSTTPTATSDYTLIGIVKDSENRVLSNQLSSNVLSPLECYNLAKTHYNTFGYQYGECWADNKNSPIPTIPISGSCDTDPQNYTSGKCPWSMLTYSIPSSSTTAVATSTTAGATSTTAGATSTTAGATSTTAGATSTTAGATSTTAGATSDYTLIGIVADQDSPNRVLKNFLGENVPTPQDCYKLAKDNGNNTFGFQYGQCWADNKDNITTPIPTITQTNSCDTNPSKYTTGNCPWTMLTYSINSPSTIAGATSTTQGATTTTAGATSTTAGATSTTAGATSTTAGATYTTTGATYTTAGATSTTTGATSTTASATYQMPSMPEFPVATPGMITNLLNNRMPSIPEFPVTKPGIPRMPPMPEFPVATPGMITNLLNNGMGIDYLTSQGMGLNSSQRGPSTNIVQTNFSGTSNVYSPFLYYNKGSSEKFIGKLYHPYP